MSYKQRSPRSAPMRPIPPAWPLSRLRLWAESHREVCFTPSTRRRALTGRGPASTLPSTRTHHLPLSASKMAGPKRDLAPTLPGADAWVVKSRSVPQRHPRQGRRNMGAHDPGELAREPLQQLPTTTPPATVAAADTAILVYGDCKIPSVEPSEIVLTCGYRWYFQGLHWWRAGRPPQATAIGTFVYNDCTPNCAKGHHHEVPSTQVTLTAPVRGASGQLVWSKLQQNPEPPGYDSGPFHGAPSPLPIRPI